MEKEIKQMIKHEGKKLFIMIIIGFVLLSFLSLVSADTKTTTKDSQDITLSPFLKTDFNSKYGAIKIKDSLSNNVIQYSLTKNTESCFGLCFGKGRATLYKDGTLFDSIYFKNSDGKTINFYDYKIYVLDGYKDNYISVPDKYKKVYSDDGKISWNEPDTYKLINSQVENWKIYNNDILPASDYIFKIAGNVPNNYKLDWVAVKNGVSLDDWATWFSNNQPTHYWKFNESNGTTQINDYGSVPFNFTLGACGSFLAGPGETGNAGRTTSVCDAWSNISVDQSFYFGTGDFTIAFWLRASSLAGEITSFQASGNSWTINSGSGLIKFNFQGSTKISATGSSISNNAWHHVVFVRNSSAVNNLAVWIDGSLNNVANDTTNITGTTGKKILWFENGGANPTDTDEGYIWKGYAVTPIDILGMYNASQGAEWTNVSSKINSQVKTYLSGVEGNNNILLNNKMNITANLTIGDFGSLNLTADGIQLNFSSTSNLTYRYTATGPQRIVNITATYSGSSTYNPSIESWSLTIGSDIPSLSSSIQYPLSPTTYGSNSNYTFNITIADGNDNIHSVKINIDNVNYTALNTSKSLFYYIISDLKAGIHTFKWFANDSNGDFNETALTNYTINQASSQIFTYLNGIRGNATIMNGSSILFNATLNLGLGTVNLYSNGNLLISGISPISNLSFYNLQNNYTILSNYSGNENYTSSFESFTLFVTNSTFVQSSSNTGIFTLDFSTSRGVTIFIVMLVISVLVLLFVHWELGCVFVMISGFIALINYSGLFLGTMIIVTSIVLIFIKSDK